MADPIPFDEMNLTLNAPEGEEENVDAMPAYTDGTFCISCWQLTPDDLARLKENGGKVWLWVWSGETQPPVCVDTVSPFDEQDDATVIGVDEGGKDTHVETILEVCPLCKGNTPSIEEAEKDGVQYCGECEGQGQIVKDAKP